MLIAGLLACRASHRVSTAREIKEKIEYGSSSRSGKDSEVRVQPEGL